MSSIGKKEREHIRIVQKSKDKLIQALLDKQGIPDTGWPEHQLDMFLNWIASLDSNNRLDVTNIGAGEREGRVICPLVKRLNCNMSHGIGRSGNLTEIQPKAIGSSMLASLANGFAQQALKIIGLSGVKASLVVPLCTGMSLSLCMTSFRRQRPTARYVVWFRVDQKSCLKSIMHAGYEPIVINPERLNDALVTNVEHLNAVLEKGADQILCVLSTTSCFAPRAPDSLEEIAALCQHYGVPHLVNNAYGLQSDECIRRINAGHAAGRIDAVVQSLDKNFQVPVGGAIIAVWKKSALNNIAESYPGRASSAPIRDFVLTMLHLGIDGLIKSYETQKRLFLKMKSRLKHFATEIGEFVYDVEDNHISLAMTISSIPQEKQSLFGAVLFSRGITGARVVTSSTEVKRIAGCDFDFKNFGSHTHEQHGGYLNIACGVGMGDEEVDELFSRLSTAYTRFTHQLRNSNGVFRSASHLQGDSDEED